MDLVGFYIGCIGTSARVREREREGEKERERERDIHIYIYVYSFYMAYQARTVPRKHRSGLWLGRTRAIKIGGLECKVSKKCSLGDMSITGMSWV